MLVYEYDCSTCENDCAHQASYWTAISLAAGQSSGGAARQHERAEAVFCHRQCRLLRIPSPQVLARYRIGQAPRLSATQQERAALVASIQQSLMAELGVSDRAWAWVHAPHEAPPFDGDSPLYFMLENGLPAMREVARMLVRESEPR